MIQKSKDKEKMPDFDEMMSEVEGDIQENDAEQDIVNRVPELKRLSANIDKATDTWVNAAIQLETAIQQYQRAELKLGNAVNSIGIKVDTINTHVDNLLRDAPDKLQVSVNVSDADWLRIQELFDKEHKWMLAKMQEHIGEVNAMFVDERRKVQKRYKEYDGCYLGHYAQWFFWFFFSIGFSVVAGSIAILLAQSYGKC